MRRVLHFVFYAALALTTAALPLLAGTVLDSVIATVNRQPILRSDWDEAVRFEAFMQQKSLEQITEHDRTLALQHLIDRQLLQAQMGDAKYLQVSDDAVKQDVAKVRAQVPNGNDDAAWQKLLAGYGLNESRLEQHLRTQVAVMNFVEVRLRPNVHVQDEEVRAYYKDQLVPDLLKNGGEPLPLEAVAPRIRELLTQQNMDELLEMWLHNLRLQAKIHSSVQIPGVNAPSSKDTVAGAN